MFPLWQGNGWGTFTYGDGSTFAFSGFPVCGFVTGPNSYVVAIGWAAGSPNTTLTTAVTLNPANCSPR